MCLSSHQEAMSHRTIQELIQKTSVINEIHVLSDDPDILTYLAMVIGISPWRNNELWQLILICVSLFCEFILFFFFDDAIAMAE